MNKLPDNKPGEDVNKPSWQEEFDKKFVSKTSDDPYGQWFKIGVLTTEVKAFIQDLLDRRVKKIAELKKPIVVKYGQRVLNARAYNDALDQAISILKEE